MTAAIRLQVEIERARYVRVLAGRLWQIARFWPESQYAPSALGCDGMSRSRYLVRKRVGLRADMTFLLKRF